MVDFVTFRLSQASCFPLFPVFVLSYANWLLAVASYLACRHESGRDLLIYLSKKVNKRIS